MPATGSSGASDVPRESRSWRELFRLPGTMDRWVGAKPGRPLTLGVEGEGPPVAHRSDVTSVFPGADAHRAPEDEKQRDPTRSDEKRLPGSGTVQRQSWRVGQTPDPDVEVELEERSALWVSEAQLIILHNRCTRS